MEWSWTKTGPCAWDRAVTQPAALLTWPNQQAGFVAWKEKWDTASKKPAVLTECGIKKHMEPKLNIKLWIHGTMSVRTEYFNIMNICK